MSDTEFHDFDAALEQVMRGFFVSPDLQDLRELDVATYALGVSFGFDDLRQAQVMANSCRYISNVARWWSEHHPSDDFLDHAARSDDLGELHRLILERAHSQCARCEERLTALRS
jgi:hypothetical protein